MIEPARSPTLATRGSAVRVTRAPEEVGIFAVLVVVALGLSLISPQFRTISNGFVLLVNGTVIAFLALGQSFVLLTGGIDLSTGANVAMSGTFANDDIVGVRGNGVRSNGRSNVSSPAYTSKPGPGSK